MQPIRHGAIALGGAVGAGVRWAVATRFGGGPGFPVPTFLVNGVGCLLLGLILAGEVRHPRRRLLLHDLGGIGFCGGLTTFSTFTVEIADLLGDGRAALAVGYLTASVATGLVAFVAGGAVARQVRGLVAPVEEP